MNEKYTVCQSGGANIPQVDPKSAMTRCRPTPPLKAHFETTLIDWVKCQIKSQVGVTVTFGAGRNGVVTYPSQRNAEEMVRKAIKRLNTRASQLVQLLHLKAQADLSASTLIWPLSRRLICHLFSSAGSWTEPSSVPNGLSSAHISKSAGAKTGLTTR